MVVYQHYADHYKIELNDKGIKATWSWLLATDHPLKGIVAEKNNTLIGLAHYKAMPSPLRGKDIGFLDDLIVVPENRGVMLHLLLNELRIIAEHGVGVLFGGSLKTIIIGPGLYTTNLPKN